MGACPAIYIFIWGVLTFCIKECTLVIEALAAAEGQRLLRLALLVVIEESLPPVVVYNFFAFFTREYVTQDGADAFLRSAPLPALPVALLTRDELLGVCHGRCREVSLPEGLMDTLRHSGHYALLCYVCRYGSWRLLPWRHILPHHAIEELGSVFLVHGDGQ